MESCCNMEKSCYNYYYGCIVIILAIFLQRCVYLLQEVSLGVLSSSDRKCNKRLGQSYRQKFAHWCLYDTPLVAI